MEDVLLLFGQPAINDRRRWGRAGAVARDERWGWRAAGMLRRERSRAKWNRLGSRSASSPVGLPPDTTALRITTTFEIRWDRVALFVRANDDSLRVTELPAASADLHFRGFSPLAVRVPHGPLTPDYDTVSPRPPWRETIAGWCTRYGDVTPLLAAPDDEYVILKGGDEVTLAFDASSLPPLPAGWRRELFFYSAGWDKDADHNVRAGRTVAPLPYRGMDDQAYGLTDAPTPPELAPWDAEYNTRYVSADRFDPARTER